MKMKTNPSLKGLLTLSGLFAFAMIIPFEVDCESLFEDENQDLLSISAAFQKKSDACHVCTFISSPSALKDSLSSHLLVAAFLSPPMNSPMALEAIMRC